MPGGKRGLVFILLLILLPLIGAVHAYRAMAMPRSVVQPPIEGPIATETQLRRAREEWAASAHADTYDDGMGANTTCARCKSPMNWDPTQDIAAQEALDCGSCKRVPGAPRPELASGVSVSKASWQNITCDVCHVPAGDSFVTNIAFWNQALGQYEPVESVMALCVKCHEGRHGFEVVEEQERSTAHHGWECTLCHGAHGGQAFCTDCHTPSSGSGAAEHERHPGVNCTACHDAGKLTIWRDPESGSSHAGEYITRRFAHTLTSWPSHNLGTQIDCQRCHHPDESLTSSLVPSVSCEACHIHEDGASMTWCIYFSRDPDPTLDMDTLK